MIQRSGTEIGVGKANCHHLRFPGRDLHEDHVPGDPVIMGITDNKSRSYLGLDLVGIGKIHKDDGPLNRL